MRKKKHPKKSLLEGKLEYTGSRQEGITEMQSFSWGPNYFKEMNPLPSLALLPDVQPGSAVWLNLHGLTNAHLITEIGKKYNLHYLHLRSVVHTELRPRTEEYASYIFSSFKTVRLDENNEIQLDQVSIFLLKNILISFRESKGNYFDHLRIKFREPDSMLRMRKPDFLLCCLLETVIDNFHFVVDQIDDELVILQDMVISSPNNNLLLRIEKLKHNFNILRRQLIPLRDTFSFFEKNYDDYIEEKNIKYFKNLNSNLTHLLDVLEANRLELEGLTNINFANQNQRLNEVIKVLTILSTIFLPLTFIAGVYGMNFDNMPELRWHLGYFFFWGLMLFLVVAMILYFRRQKWL